VRAALAALALVLAACASVPSTPPPVLAGVPKAFEMSGRISIRQGDRSDIARLRWTHRAGADEWVFASPLGNEVARIRSSATGALLERAGGPRDEAATFAELTERLLGIPIDPVDLSAWLHGSGSARAAPAQWTVTVDERQRAGAVDLARRVTASRGEVVVRLVVDEYRALEE
jgi:outer membrane biogenesis lipoprotein LolB